MVARSSSFSMSEDSGLWRVFPVMNMSRIERWQNGTQETPPLPPKPGQAVLFISIPMSIYLCKGNHWDGSLSSYQARAIYNEIWNSLMSTLRLMFMFHDKRPPNMKPPGSRNFWSARCWWCSQSSPIGGATLWKGTLASLGAGPGEGSHKSKYWSLDRMSLG